MNRKQRKPYDPLMILLMPRWSSAALSVQTFLGVIDNVDYALAVASDAAEAARFRSSWTGMNEVPLVVLRLEPDSSCKWAVEAVSQISKSKGKRAVCVLLADGYDVNGYSARKQGKWNRLFAEMLQRTVLDSQIHEFSRSWATSPPRSR